MGACPGGRLSTIIPIIYLHLPSILFCVRRGYSIRRCLTPLESIFIQVLGTESSLYYFIFGLGFINDVVMHNFDFGVPDSDSDSELNKAIQISIANDKLIVVCVISSPPTQTLR